MNECFTKLEGSLIRVVLQLLTLFTILVVYYSYLDYYVCMRQEPSRLVLVGLN